MAVFDLDPEVAAALLTPAPLLWSDLSPHGALPDVAHVPGAVIVRFLYDLPAHGGVTGAGDERVGLVVKEVRTSFVVERVTLVALDGSTKVRSALTRR